MLARITIALLLAAGCSGGGSTVKPDPAPTGSGSAAGSGSDSGTGSADPTQGPPQTGKIGQSCGAADACLEGTCVSYYGIAGPRGPEFKSCEIKCGSGAAACPAGKQCITIADGPGLVCR
jgi:hypothetical protein